LTTTGLTSLQAQMRADLNARLAAHLPRLGWDAGQLASHQQERLRALLVHAVTNSAFHADRLAHIEPAGFRIAELDRLPTMTRAQLMASFDDVATDRRVRLSLVEQHLAKSARDASLLLGDYVCLASGGSSGQRGVFVQTLGEYADHVASILRRLIARHRASGAAGGLHAAMVGAPSPVHSTGFAAAAARGEPVALTSVPVTLPLAAAVTRLHEVRPAVLVGYPTRIAELAGEQRAGRLRIGPRAIITTAEMLTDAARLAIADGFGVPPVNTFASTEGLVGHSDPGGTELTFASDMCLTELVDSGGRPVPPGTPSARVLVTNLHNFSQPMIRYELTDSFTACARAGSGGPLRALVAGRDDGSFRYGAVVVHPIAVRTVMTAAPAVTEYQVRQTARGVDLDVVAAGHVDQRAVSAAVAASLTTAGLRDPAVTVRVVASIARHPATGKTRRFVPIGP
jgi:phenylacetate-CoA ligase